MIIYIIYLAQKNVRTTFAKYLKPERERERESKDIDQVRCIESKNK